MDILDEDEPRAKPGHNSGVAPDILKSVVDRMENLQCDIDELKDDQKEIMQEAKSQGFNPKTIRTVLAIRKKRKEEREAELAELDLYLHALEMI